MVRYEIQGGDIAVITWDLPGRPVNVMNLESLRAFGAACRRAVDDPEVRGAVVASAKRDFIAGADLRSLLADRRAEILHANTRAVQDMLRAIERSGKPFVAALNDTTLGGGLEIALACHRRIAADRPDARLGFPEVTLGLLPGAGGTQRLPRLIGVREALDLLLDGKRVNPREALAAGIVDELAAPDALLPRAIHWIKASTGADAVKPWDRAGYRPPGEALGPTGAYRIFALETARRNARTFGNLPLRGTSSRASTKDARRTSTAASRPKRAISSPVRARSSRRVSSAPRSWERLAALAARYAGRPPLFASGWGSTETVAAATMVHFPIERAGNIGLPVPGTEIKLAPDADKFELRVRGPAVAPGYWMRPALTAAAFDEEGFFRTGDAGRLVDPRRPEAGIAFDGRIAENFKLSTGRWVHVGDLRMRAIAAGAPKPVCSSSPTCPVAGVSRRSPSQQTSPRSCAAPRCAGKWRRCSGGWREATRASRPAGARYS